MSGCLPSQSPVAQVAWVEAAARALLGLAVSQLLTAAAGTAENNSRRKRDFLGGGEEERKEGKRA